MTATELSAYAEMYDALGAIARESALGIDALRVGCDGPVDQLVAALRETMRRLERVHAIAASERERWAR